VGRFLLAAARGAPVLVFLGWGVESFRRREDAGAAAPDLVVAAAVL
jgi:hypothetical protein